MICPQVLRPSTSTSLPDLKISMPDLKISIPAKAPESPESTESTVPGLRRITDIKLPLHVEEVLSYHSDADQTRMLVKNAFGQGQLVFCTQPNTNPPVSNCSICLQALFDGNMIVMNKCGHFFCQGCHQKWAKKSDNCALCRQSQGTEPDNSDDSDDSDDSEREYDSDGPGYDPISRDMFSVDDILPLNEEELAEIGEYMDEVPPRTVFSPFQLDDEGYNDTSSDDDDDVMMASHQNFEEQLAIINSLRHWMNAPRRPVPVGRIVSV